MLKIISRWAIPINLMEKGVDREFLFFVLISKAS
jgi:hypothetical protein